MCVTNVIAIILDIMKFHLVFFCLSIKKNKRLQIKKKKKVLSQKKIIGDLEMKEEDMPYAIKNLNPDRLLLDR